MHRVFRFDDVCGNADLSHINALADAFHTAFDDSEIWYCVSPLYFDMHAQSKHPIERQRVFPRMLNAYSDHTRFYRAEKCCTLKHESFPEYVTLASHGLIHVDHRLMGYEAQELSIVSSCALTDARLFVPPFNKWNHDTEEVCRKHNIALVKFEDNWKCIEYEPFDPTLKKWYLHARELTLESLNKWIHLGKRSTK